MKLILVIITFAPLIASPQKSLSLQQSIDSALVYSHKLQSSEINLEIKGQEYKSAKLNFLPTINGNASHGYNWGQTIDPFTNQFATDRVQYNNFSLSSSATLFSGLQKYYSKRLSSINQQIAREEDKLDEFIVVQQVISAYLQLSLNQKIVDLNLRQMEYSNNLIQRSKTLVEMEYHTTTLLLESEAMYTEDETRWHQSQRDYLQSLLTFKQIIGLTIDTTKIILSDSIKCNYIYDSNQTDALNELYSEQGFQNIALSKAQFFPKLTLNASLGSGYSENNKFQAPTGEFVPRPFSDQLESNFYQSVSATLSIPIFSGTQTYSRLKVSRLEHEAIIIDAETNLRDYEIQKLSASLDVNNAIQVLKSAKKSSELNQLLFENSRIQYDNGEINYYDFIQSKNQAYQAEIDVIQAELILKFKTILYDFYD
ncbi:MAG: TolC family protein [Crocinitomicaceae bacterium]|nr:TolC family protein [Crocinitomicaceae bacterium]